VSSVRFRHVASRWAPALTAVPVSRPTDRGRRVGDRGGDRRYRPGWRRRGRSSAPRRAADPS